MKILIILSAVFAYAVSDNLPFVSPISFLSANDVADEISTHVSGGSLAAINQFPWMVSVRAGSGTNITTCGGSLIAGSWVLTSASCVFGYGSVTLGFGSVDINNSSHIQTLTATNFLIHPAFNAITLANNIALIRLSTVVPLGPGINTIRLINQGQAKSDFIGIGGVVMGWGQTVTGSPVSVHLSWVFKRTITNLMCTYIYKPIVITASVLCAEGWDSVTNNACDGDAGGSLIITEQGTNTLIGVVSFVSSRGCTAGDPSGYTRVGSYLPWISTHTGIAIRP